MGFLFRTKPDAVRQARLEQTQRNQADAADPSASAWVSANAGTGKTHVLTMRVLRLLLDGTPPERILALTYTKAAAAEMSKRVFARLGEWVTAGDDALNRALAELLGCAPRTAEMQLARQLFAVAIETPGGLKVQTIHAFCERLLQRFPIEAGVAPGFAILDEHERRALLAEAADATLAEASAANAGTPLASALHTAVAFATDVNFDQLLAEVLREQEWLTAAVRLDDGDDTFAEVESIYRKAIGLSAKARTADVEARFAALLSEAELQRLKSILAGGSANDLKACERVAAVQRATGPATRIEALCSLFLTDDGDPRKALLTKALSAANPDVHAVLLRAQAQCQALREERCKLALLDAALALVRLGNAVMQRYGAAKARRAALDFEDLVARAASLLGSSEAVEWVLYKLDGGLDHILVDEAQDTSPVQWDVIRALAEEFFSGTGAREVVRTLFAVGDEKQSIYGFQGAAPNMFAAMGETFARQAERAGLALRRVPLNLSFRAVEPLLTAVDRVFAAPERTPGVGVAGGRVEHVAHRAGQAGLIEIWPTEARDEPQDTEPWSPLEEKAASSPVVRLAARIARTIHGWLQSGEKLASENRPIRAGDILILVRKRVPFAPAMISALKARGLKVAGADRLVLTEQIAVQDLMALGDFLTLPEDDLALAAVLKSPLFGLDDDDLTVLAPGRQGSLWQELVIRAAANPRFANAAETLKRWRALAEQAPPFEFYSALLDREGMRARMLERLGAEAADAIDELLNLALAYDDDAAPSLQGFLGWLRQGPREIKRDMEQGRDEVRVMTVHGAKGLEAPIVFLPDTCSTASGRRPGSLLRLENAERPLNVPAPVLWPVKGTSNLAVVQQAKAAVARAEAEERNRLLYVALTRARDRLYVAGFEGARGLPQDCWYNIVRDGLADRLEEVATADGRTVWRLSSAQTAKPEAAKATPGDAAAAAPLPAWARRPAPVEPLLTVPLAPSRLAPLESDAAGEPVHQPPGRLADPAILSPAALAEDARFLRGTLTHALLEHLPTLPQASWAAAAQAFIASRAAQLPASVRKAIVAEALAVLRDPAFAALFGPHARAEVAIAAEIPHPRGLGPALRLNGKIDRLVREKDGILIVDYKTNRPPPTDPAHVAETYLLQLAGYRLAVGRIFSQTHVRAAILWTDGPRIMEIPAKMLDEAERRLWQLDPANLDA
jgi:ATP-dependent helicase/nuclease subunit A